MLTIENDLGILVNKENNSDVIGADNSKTSGGRYYG